VVQHRVYFLIVGTDQKAESRTDPWIGDRNPFKAKSTVPEPAMHLLDGKIVLLDCLAFILFFLITIS